MLDKKICREFAAPGIAMSMNSGLLHAEQVKYIVQTAVKIISHKRTLQRKRVEELLLAFGGFNSTGQKSVMRHIRELAQVPAYQAQPHLSGFASKDRQVVEAELATIKNARYELDLMDGRKMTPGKASAIASSARLLSGATDRLVELLCKGQALDEPESGE